MATYTPNLNLKKPGASDYALISDINGNMDTLDTVVAGKLDSDAAALKAKGLIYLEPTVTTTGVLWTATSSDITAYYDGLMVAVLCPENTASGLTLKINSLTAPTIVYNATSAISSRYSADSIIILTYKTISGTSYWSIMDYDANADTKVRQYQATNNVNYPILTRYNTTDKSGTYEATYARFAPAVTVNPSTGNVSATKFNGYVLGAACEKAIGSIASGNTGLVTGGDVYTAMQSAGGAVLFKSVSASSWTADQTYADFPYRCAIALTGVTAADVAEIVFSQEQASSGEYAQVCETYAGGVYIYSTSNTAITIPTVIVHKG